VAAEFVRIIQRHKQRMAKYPDEPPAFGRPYDGIENLRPESIAAAQRFLTTARSYFNLCHPCESRDPSMIIQLII